MAGILDRYGIKEVADVTFYNIDKDTALPTYPVLYLDTLKVSTIEQTAETTDARGGKGNPKLITWDYGKDITVTLEDALFSAKSLAIMFGNGTVNPGENKVQRTVMARLGTDGKLGEVSIDVYDNITKGAVRKKLSVSEFAANNVTDVKVYDETGVEISESAGTYTGTPNTRVFVTYNIAVKNNKEIVISADTFPGTYYVTGDTYARSDIDGSDQFFQFIIQKAKVTSENTITLEAEGDPSVFNMNLSVLRPEDGEMMKLVQYDLSEGQTYAITGPTTVKVDGKITLVSDVASTETGFTWISEDTTEATVAAAAEVNGKLAANVTGVKEGTVAISLMKDGQQVAKHVVTVTPKTSL